MRNGWRDDSSKTGFTLAELLIALAILGVVATFTIPKVLSTQQDQKYNAIAKEAVGMVSAAYAQYRQANGLTASSGAGQLTPYLNYVSMTTDRSDPGVRDEGLFPER